MTGNSGQSRNAPTRMFVPAERVVVGAIGDERSTIGPVVSKVQFGKIQHLIQACIDEGAELVAGGPGRSENLNRGCFVRPTVFANVRNDMTIAREEISGPVLAILPYRGEAKAIRPATPPRHSAAISSPATVANMADGRWTSSWKPRR